MSEKILVTGAAGFIGSRVCEFLLDREIEVLGIDNLNSYYDPKLKHARLERISQHPQSGKFRFEKIDVSDRSALETVYKKFAPQRFIHLAAQAGVRHSLTKPEDYVTANITGFLNVLEVCRHQGTQHLVYASTSSVYGANTKMPFSVHKVADHPVSFYGATKRANELMAHSYSHLFQVPTTGLRFFTVYGPWGRPDMAMFLFMEGILKGKPIQIFNHGEMMRDFTYVDDVAEGVVRVAFKPPAPNPQWNSDDPDPATSRAPYRIFNIGNHEPVRLMRMIETLEKAIGKTALKEYLPMQKGDVPATYADLEEFYEITNFRPQVSIEAGVAAFVKWYQEFYRV
jgi:UDP-glucuronate 4-epimerase